MKVSMTISIVLSLLLICTPAAAQEAATELLLEDTPGRVPELPLATPAVPDILSAIPADAYGFIATKNLQASYDNIMLFAKALGVPTPDLNVLLAVEENLGQVDLNGPAAVVLLDPQKFPEPPIVLLFSASDPQAVFNVHQANAEGTDEELPPGVVKGADGYVAVKQGFVVFAPEADNVAAVLAEQAPLQIMPAAKEAFDKGQIVLAGDIQQAAPFIMQSLNMIQAQMTAQMAQGPQMPQMTMVMEMVSVYMDCAQSLIQQSDKLTVALDINAEQAVLTKRVLFKADSPAAAFVNAQMGQKVPSYTALPAGPFLLAAATSMAPEQLSSLAETFMNKFANLPSFKKTLSDEQTTEMISEMKAFYAGSSTTAITFNIGSPMTGMFNMVGRYDVPDSAAFKKQMGEMYQAPYMTAWMESFGIPLKYIYTPAAENYSGVDIDTIKMEMTPPEAGAEPDPTAQQMQMMMAQQMQMMYGPDMSFRLAAPNDKQVLFVMGG
ncbi:MAG: hypothetical protein KAT11_07115, partial [Phycisphaerae bacterium]|nr:hypothetical protein [Phycisphaerae bacterium]